MSNETLSGIVLLDKEAGISSQKAVFQVRRLFDVKKAGHGGTLDPMAEGLLPVLLGSATKLSDYLLTGDKGYLAGLRFGVETDTLDTTGTVLSTSDKRPTREQLEQALSLFRGQITQVPPMYSAISVGGEKLYKLARQGIEVEREARSVTIHRLTLQSFDGDSATLDIGCSKGTYVRTLIADLGRALGCGACMSSLRRTEAAGFQIEGSFTRLALEQLSSEGRLSEALLPPEVLFTDLPAVSTIAFYDKLLFDGQKVLQKKTGSRLAPGQLARWIRRGQFGGLVRETETEQGSAVQAVWRL
ncbi:MAG: tRNA pseudouridine(55) synthase TruB [Clostridia bacterium]|nr:tRNA pseudouridine(55) synthase TruB [Clostridia bacterium]